MRFQFFPLRFEFRAADSIGFAPGKAGNILRGALGTVSRGSLAYGRVFEPTAIGPGPSGLGDLPRPFVFRARHLDGLTISRGESFHFDLHLFSLEPEVLQYFVRSFAALAHEGLGNERGKAELQSVRRLAWGDLPEQAPVEPVSLDLEAATSTANRIRVEFLSPTELKHDRRITDRPEFAILFARIRDRISTLRALYGPGALDIDFKEIGERAAAIRMTACEIRRQEVERRSTKTGQTHSIGGFVGFAEYEGELGEFLPYLEAAQWVGVGRQAVWGKGEISVLVPVG